MSRREVKFDRSSWDIKNVSFTTSWSCDRLASEATISYIFVKFWWLWGRGRPASKATLPIDYGRLSRRDYSCRESRNVILVCHLQPESNDGRLEMSWSWILYQRQNHIYKMSHQQRRRLHLDIWLTGIFEDHWAYQTSEPRRPSY